MSDLVRFGPPDDEPMLPSYGGAFSHAFVALHPFMEIDGLDPSTCSTGTIILSGSDFPVGRDFIEWITDVEAQRRAGKEFDGNSLDEIAIQFAKKVGWRSICQDAGFADHCELDLALRTMIGGLKAELQDQKLAKRLVDFCQQRGFFLPTEGRFEPVMQTALAEVFERAGYTEIYAGDEFGDDDRLVPVNFLANGKPWKGGDELPSFGPRRLYAPDQTLLAWVHWDSFYTVIFGTEASLRDAKLGENFEGFWCSEETQTYWLMQPCIPLTQ